jgi:hypothetical protein
VQRRIAVEQVHRHHEHSATKLAQGLRRAVEAAGQWCPGGVAQGMFMVFALIEGTGADRQVETGAGERQRRLATDTMASMPPSTNTTLPWTNDACGDCRKATTAAISSG